jgi:hypothetical protein
VIKKNWSGFGCHQPASSFGLDFSSFPLPSSSFHSPLPSFLFLPLPFYSQLPMTPLHYDVSFGILSLLTQAQPTNQPTSRYKPSFRSKRIDWAPQQKMNQMCCWRIVREEGRGIGLQTDTREHMQKRPDNVWNSFAQKRGYSLSIASFPENVL